MAKEATSPSTTVIAQRRRDVAEFAAMLRRGAHVLGRDPEQLFQLASYEPGGTAPALLAERRWELVPTGRPWLRLLDPGALADPGVMTLVGHGGEISACAYSPDGRSILSASWDQTLRRWDVATGELQQVLSGHDAWVLSCCFSPDGHRIVSASRGDSRIWDAATGRELRALPRPAANFSDCAVSPEGTEVLTVAWDRTLSLWGLEDGILRWSVAGHQDMVRAGAFSPDGKRLVTASSDKTVKLWRRETGEVIRVLRGHRYQVFDCAYSPDGTLVLSASGDKTLKLWTAEPRKGAWWRFRSAVPGPRRRPHPLR